MEWIFLYRDDTTDEIGMKDLRDAGYSGPGYYFWDETQSKCHGPFATRAEASKAMRMYAGTL